MPAAGVDLVCPHCQTVTTFPANTRSLMALCPACKRQFAFKRPRKLSRDQERRQDERFDQHRGPRRSIRRSKNYDGPSQIGMSGLVVGCGLAGLFFGFLLAQFGPLIGYGPFGALAQPFSRFRFQAAIFYMPTISIVSLVIGGAIAMSLDPPVPASTVIRSTIPTAILCVIAVIACITIVML